jgi:hypothetical protein
MTNLSNSSIFLSRKNPPNYLTVERVGGANDKGRDVIGFLTPSRHEGDWHLFQCKRKTRGAKLKLPEALLELGKVFYHHSEGAYATLPTKIVFVSPRGIVGPLMTLLHNPSTVAPALIGNWDSYCRDKITNVPVPLTDELKALIDGYDFANVEHLTAPLIVKDPAARPGSGQGSRPNSGRGIAGRNARFNPSRGTRVRRPASPGLC